MKRFLLPLVLLLAPSLAFAGDASFTLTTAPVIVVPGGYHTTIAIDNESTTIAVACSFLGTPAVNTAGSWTIPFGATRAWSSNPRTGASAIPGTPLKCVAASTTAAITVEHD